MLRVHLNEAMKAAMLAKDSATLSTVRLILAALKDLDIAARPAVQGISDDAILSMLQGMIKQRQESVKLYLQGNRPELAAGEENEIKVIRRFLPEQMDEAAVKAAAQAVVTELGASSVKDMARVMSALKERFAGKMDLGAAGAYVKTLLS